MPFKFSDVKVSLSNIYRNEVNRIPKYSLALVYETQRSRVLDIFLLFHKKKKIHPQNVVYKIRKETKPLQAYIMVGTYYVFITRLGIMLNLMSYVNYYHWFIHEKP